MNIDEQVQFFRDRSEVVPDGFDSSMGQSLRAEQLYGPNVPMDGDFEENEEEDDDEDEDVDGSAPEFSEEKFAEMFKPIMVMDDAEAVQACQYHQRQLQPKMSLREVQQARPDEEELKEFFLNERSNSDVNDRLKQCNAGEVSE